MDPHGHPNFERLRKVLLREGIPDRVPFIELYVDDAFVEAVLGEKMPSSRALRESREARERRLDLQIRFRYEMGYDHAMEFFACEMPFGRLAAKDTAQLSSNGKRLWVNENRGIINSCQDFECYPWPRPEEIDYGGPEYMARHLPDGMKLICDGIGGILELVMWLMGYVPLAYALADEPDLVKALFERVGSLTVTAYRNMAEIDNVGALCLGDDMGFKHATMIHPDLLRHYVLPWHKTLADIAHEHDLPYIVHSCGNLEEIMDDLIDVVGINGKHSFEDASMPVTEAKKRYGGRIAILGGIDVDTLARASEEQVRACVRRTLRECGSDGGYALGSGNSLPGYVRVNNYLAMLDEGRRHGRYPLLL